MKMPYKNAEIARQKALERYQKNRVKRQQQMRDYNSRPETKDAEKIRSGSRTSAGYHTRYYRKNKDEILARQRERRLANPVLFLWQNAKQRAKKFSLPFNISPDDIAIPSRCPVLGHEFEYGKGKHYPWAPSLDRIIPALGYVVGNIKVISFRANKLKGDASIEELQAVLRYLIEE